MNLTMWTHAILIGLMPSAKAQALSGGQTLISQAVVPTGATSNNQIALAILLFTLAGTLFVLGVLTIGRLLRPKRFHPEKATPYECGEPAIGDSWVQFDLRFYTVALIFIVFDVEVALLWPWAVVFKGMLGAAFWPFLIFFLLIAIPFIYEWSSGYLDWVRASTGQRRRES